MEPSSPLRGEMRQKGPIKSGVGSKARDPGWRISKQVDKGDDDCFVPLVRIVLNTVEDRRDISRYERFGRYPGRRYWCKLKMQNIVHTASTRAGFGHRRASPNPRLSHAITAMAL